MKIGIFGYGYVGKFMHSLFPDAAIYDKYIPEYSDITQAGNADIVFIAVPTNNLPDGSLDMSGVEECVSLIQHRALIVSRSTLNPGTADYLSVKYKKRIVVQPEHTGESPQHPFTDSKSRQFLIIGGESKDRRELIDLYYTKYNASVDIMQVTAYEAEIIKLAENRAIAFKVAQCQELYDICEKVGVDYYTIRDGVYKIDPRFDTWFTAVYPDNRGMNSKCIPKDPKAFVAWCRSNKYEPVITHAINRKNEDWVGMNK